MEKMFVFLDIA